MSHVANQLTSPLGIRLFPGDYPDRGLGDQALAASKPLQAAGTNLISQGEQSLPFLMSMLTGGGTTQGAGGGKVKTDSYGQPIGGTTGAYGLSPVFQSQLDALSAPINAARKTALQAAKASMSARGLGGSPGAEKALEEYINANANTDLTNAHNSVLQAQQQSFQTALQDALNMIGIGGGLVGQNVGTLQQQAAAAQQRTQQASSDLFSAIGAGFAGANLFGGGKGTPTTGTPSGGSSGGAGLGPYGSQLGSLGSSDLMFGPTNTLGTNYGAQQPIVADPATGKNVFGRMGA